MSNDFIGEEFALRNEGAKDSVVFPPSLRYANHL